MIEPKEFEKRFCDWVDAVCQKVEGDIISVDGKTLRRSGSNVQKPLHMVSAWSSKQQMVMGQIATAEKSNEMTAVPELLEILDVAGCIITSDAIFKPNLSMKKKRFVIAQDVEKFLEIVMCA